MSGAQAEHIEEAVDDATIEEDPDDATSEEAGMVVVHGAVWIPHKCLDLKLHLLIAAHAGTAGHRGSGPTWNALREKCTCSGFREDVRFFLPLAYCA